MASFPAVEPQYDLYPLTITDRVAELTEITSVDFDPFAGAGPPHPDALGTVLDGTQMIGAPIGPAGFAGWNQDALPTGRVWFVAETVLPANAAWVSLEGDNLGTYSYRWQFDTVLIVAADGTTFPLDFAALTHRDDQVLVDTFEEWFGVRISRSMTGQSLPEIEAAHGGPLTIRARMQVQNYSPGSIFASGNLPYRNLQARVAEVPQPSATFGPVDAWIPGASVDADTNGDRPRGLHVTVTDTATDDVLFAGLANGLSWSQCMTTEPTRVDAVALFDQFATKTPTVEQSTVYTPTVTVGALAPVLTPDATLRRIAVRPGDAGDPSYMRVIQRQVNGGEWVSIGPVSAVDAPEIIDRPPLNDTLKYRVLTGTVGSDTIEVSPTASPPFFRHDSWIIESDSKQLSIPVGQVRETRSSTTVVRNHLAAASSLNIGNLSRPTFTLAFVAQNTDEHDDAMAILASSKILIRGAHGTVHYVQPVGNVTSRQAPIGESTKAAGQRASLAETPFVSDIAAELAIDTRFDHSCW